MKTCQEMKDDFGNIYWVEFQCFDLLALLLIFIAEICLYFG